MELWIGLGLVAMVVILVLLARAKPKSSGISAGLLAKCGGCGSTHSSDLEVVRDKNNNRGYLCSSCKREYAALLKPDSIRRFWMCGVCKFRILAGTRVDAEVDPHSKCPQCGADVNSALVNLSNDRPVKSGMVGEPVG